MALNDVANHLGNYGGKQHINTELHKWVSYKEGKEIKTSATHTEADSIANFSKPFTYNEIQWD